ncbi:MAG: RNA methyltransferase [bacterium]|nr:RNA methyltransferase [bacterium]
MQFDRIGDFEDPRIGDYQNLKEVRLAVDRRRFMVEGRVNLRVLLEHSTFAPDSILLSDRARATMEEELVSLAPTCPVYVANQAVLDRIVGFPIHRGCLAACRRPEGLDPMALARDLLEVEAAPRIVVVENITNHDNMGGIFRNAMGLGGRAVLLCPRSVDPLYRKAIRTSMGGSLVLPFARTADLAQLLDALRKLGFEILALDPAPESVDLDGLVAREIGPVALLLGTEGPGLSEMALALADRRVRIAMESGVDSLNVSVAAGIALHRLRVQDSDTKKSGLSVGCAGSE